MVNKDKRIEVLKTMVSTYKRDLKLERGYQKTLENQYNRVVAEYRKLLQDSYENAPKHFVLYLNRKVKKWLNIN